MAVFCMLIKWDRGSGRNGAACERHWRCRFQQREREGVRASRQLKEAFINTVRNKSLPSTQFMWSQKHLDNSHVLHHDRGWKDEGFLPIKATATLTDALSRVISGLEWSETWQRDETLHSHTNIQPTSCAVPEVERWSRQKHTQHPQEPRERLTKKNFLTVPNICTLQSKNTHFRQYQVEQWVHLFPDCERDQ